MKEPNVLTHPGWLIMPGITIDLPRDCHPTLGTSGASGEVFAKLRHLFSDKPLRGIRQIRLSDDILDEDDVKAATRALRSDERVPYDQVRRELGLDD